VTEEGLEVARMMWWNWGSSGLTMWLLSGLSLGGLALLIGLALRTDFPPRSPSADQKLLDPKLVLALRFARGDIDVAEYLNRMDALSEAVHGG
jgi:hypothetical protein